MKQAPKMNPQTSFGVPHPRPTHLSDPFKDNRVVELDALLALPDSDLGSGDYQRLFSVGVPAGTYTEVVYFLPRAFGFLLSHDEEAIDCVTEVAWFMSEYADDLRRDGLIQKVRGAMGVCLDHWSTRFEVQHWDRAGCEAKGWELNHNDIVKNGELIVEALRALTEHSVHADLAHNFVRTLCTDGCDATRAAWFLGLAREQADLMDLREEHPGVPLPTSFPSSIRTLLGDQRRLVRAAEMVRSGFPKADILGTYWTDTFAILAL